MSCVRCSMKVLRMISCELCAMFDGSSQWTIVLPEECLGYGLVVPFPAYGFALWFRIMKLNSLNIGPSGSRNRPGWWTLKRRTKKLSDRVLTTSHATVSHAATQFAPEYGRYLPRRSTRSCHPQEVVTQSVPQTVDTVTVDTVHTVGLQGEECCASASSPVLHLPLPLTLAG